MVVNRAVQDGERFRYINIQKTKRKGSVYYKGEAVSYNTHYFCSHCPAWFQQEVFDPEIQALCPQCGHRVRTKPRQKNRSTYERKYVDVK